MKRYIGILPVMVLALASISPVSAMPNASGTVRTLYRATWSGGLAGWTPVGPGWTVVRGSLNYNGKSDGEILAPFTVNASSSFAVEAQIERIGGVGDPSDARGYGVLARGTGSDNSGVLGGFFYGDFSQDPQSGLYWNGDTVAGDDVALHAGYNTFRLEVRGTKYSVIENGVSTAHFTISDARTGSRVGIFGRGYHIRVHSFRVVTLGKAHSSSGVSLIQGPLPPVKALNLQAGDLGSGFHKTYGHYYTNAEIARDRGVSLSSIAAYGRIISYGNGFQRPLAGDVEDVQGTVSACQTSQGAQTDLDYLITQVKLRSFLPGYTVSTPGQFGEEDFEATYPEQVFNQSDTVYVLDFRRGRYRASIQLTVPAGSLPQDQALALLAQTGHAMDRRIQQKG